MTDRIDRLSTTLEPLASESPSSDAYIERIVQILEPEIEGINGQVNELKPTDVKAIPDQNARALSGEVYGPKVVGLGSKSSSIDSQTRIQTETTAGPFGLDVFNIPTSSTGVKLVDFRARATAVRKSLKEKELALAA